MTIPRAIRERMGMKTGDKIAFVLLSNGTLVVRPKTRSAHDLAGMLRRAGQPTIPLEAMQVDLAENDPAK
ncbi:hypothetical protein GCM10025795_42140 [Verticiella sediminum]